MGNASVMVATLLLLLLRKNPSVLDRKSFFLTSRLRAMTSEEVLAYQDSTEQNRFRKIEKRRNISNETVVNPSQTLFVNQQSPSRAGPSSDLVTSQPTCSEKIEESSLNSKGIPRSLSITLVVVSTVATALFAGLTLGLLGLDKTHLEIIMNHSLNPKAAAQASRIYPVRCNGNLLLCTLIWCNVACDSLLSILLAGLLGQFEGCILATCMVTVMGTIVPQAVCSRHGLLIGSAFASFVKALMWILFPITFPLAWVLDRMLGPERGIIYTQEEFEHLFNIHADRGVFNRSLTTVMTGALKHQVVKVSEVMTPFDQVYMLSVDERLSCDTILAIFKMGYSRIPVYKGNNKSNVVGLLLTKDLIFLDPEHEISVQNFIRIFGRSKL